MKTFLKIVLGFIGFIVVVIAIAFFFTSGVAKVGEDFFDSASDKNFSAAYSMLAKEFQAGTNEQQLQSFLESHSMDDVASVSWSSRSIDSGKGELAGSLTTSTGATIPIKLNLVKEDGQWKIYNINKPSAGIEGESSGIISLPSESEQIALVGESMAAFGKAVQEKSMLSFHSYISQLWQKQYTVEMLDQAYSGLYQNPPTFGFLETVSPVFSKEVELDQDNVMRITGYYPLRNNKVHFEQMYVKEGLSWKLLGFNIRGE